MIYIWFIHMISISYSDCMDLEMCSPLGPWKGSEPELCGQHGPYVILLRSTLYEPIHVSWHQCYKLQCTIRFIPWYHWYQWYQYQYGSIMWSRQLDQAMNIEIDLEGAIDLPFRHPVLRKRSENMKMLYFATLTLWHTFCDIPGMQKRKTKA